MTEQQQADPAAKTPLNALQGDETGTAQAILPDGRSDAAQADSEPDVFPRTYVEQLRRESAGYREKAKQAEQDAAEANSYAEGFMRRLHTELVKATGMLADPADLEYQPEHLMDEDSLQTAIDALLAEKPHLRARRVAGDVGQGDRGPAAEFSLLEVLKSRA